MFLPNALVVETERLQKFAMRLTRNKADAEDLLQSTCLRALEKAHQFEAGTNLFSWTAKIMYNLFLTSFRRQKYESQYDPQPYLDKATVEPKQQDNAELNDVKRAMMRLSSEHREILVLICVQNMAYQEISDKLQIPLGTVRSRLNRARLQLQRLMDRPTSDVIMRHIIPERINLERAA
jgi:RNA polymerase sigma-70 factor, ECF subfamily